MDHSMASLIVLVSDCIRYQLLALEHIDYNLAAAASSSSSSYAMFSFYLVYRVQTERDVARLPQPHELDTSILRRYGGGLGCMTLSKV